MPREISVSAFGIEDEQSYLLVLPGGEVRELVGECHSVDVDLDLYQTPTGRGIDAIEPEDFDAALESMGIYRNGNDMLSNGGRSYIDPSGSEYDTAETASAEEAVYRSFDGTDILDGAFRWLRDQEIIDGWQINRRVVDHNRTSRGIHLNTSTLLGEKPSTNTIEWLAALNVAKGGMFGSGGLLINGEGETEFHHSPRLSLTNELSAKYSNYTRRPLVRVPFKDDGPDLRRIETTSGDALNFAWPMRASLVITDAVVKLIELGYGGRLPQLTSPITAAQVVGQHGNEKRIEVVINGKTRELLPSTILRGISRNALDVDKTREYLSPEARQVLNEIMDVSTMMERDPKSVGRDVESVARQAYLQKRMKDLKVGIDSEKICRSDYAWDVKGGIAEMLRQQNKVGWRGFKQGWSQAAARRRRVAPPQNTRAKIRGDVIRQSGGADFSGWSYVDTGKGNVYVPVLVSDRPNIRWQK